MYDIVFFHPPTSLEKLRYPMSGVFAALVGSTDVLGHEPVGMISMARDLLHRGYDTKIFNVGKMLLELRERGETDIAPIGQCIEDLQARIYAVGLHWAAHAPGAIALARLIRQYHPESFVLLGGMTATYYHREILERHPLIDMVVLGEVDGVIHEIVDALLDGVAPESIPNVAYRKDGEVVSTALKAPSKKDLIYVRGQGDELIEPNTAFAGDSRQRMGDCMIPLVHGCPRACPFCGGSSYFYKKCFCRDRPEGMRAEEVVENIGNSISQGASGFSLFGDVRFLGDPYWKTLTDILSRQRMHFDLYLELFSPASREYMEAWRNTTSGQVVMALSPESADARVRKALGKHYTNEDIIEQVAKTADAGIGLSLGFMFALPEQDFASIMRTQDFINDLCRRFDRLVSYMFEPFLFMDPGSLIFDDPGRYGYNIQDRTLEGLIKALCRAHWYYSLNYSTRWLSKKEIVDAMFFVGESRNALYMEFLGPSEENLAHRDAILQQKELVRIFEKNAHLSNKAVQEIIERIVDIPFRQKNLSITGPDFDLAGRGRGHWSMSRIFRNTIRVISRCYAETGGQQDVLEAFDKGGLFDDLVPVEAVTEELTELMTTQRTVTEIVLKVPKEVWKRFHALVATLGLSLEGGLIEEFIRFDWALSLVGLYGEMLLKDFGQKAALDPDIRKAQVLLPLKNAYVRLSYRPDGKVVKKRHWLAVEKKPTFLLIAYSGEVYPVTKGEFTFLKQCGSRLLLPAFYKKVSTFAREPEGFIEWLLNKGLVLFAPPGPS